MFGTDTNKIVATNYLNYLVKFIVILIVIMVATFVIVALKLGIFEDKMMLVNYIKKVGILAPITFIMLQLLQVIIPVIPGGISCLAGVLAFGPVFGFIYNYIGLVMGSCIAYYLSKRFGIKIIKKFFKEATINKYLNYIKTNHFRTIFLMGILFPGLPDDLLCYIAGISTMKFKPFILTVLIGKPLSLFMYSVFMHTL